MAEGQNSMFPGTSPVPGEPAEAPLHGSGLLVRIAPFAVVTVLAEASLVLSPGPASWWASLASAVLLLAVAAAFLLPWSRLPAWAQVLVPLGYTGWVLALILAVGTTSGVGIVILVPLIWAALFHRRWESACVVAAIAAVEVIISITPVTDPAAVITRRVILWALLGALISVATHGLRDRIRAAQQESAELQARLREVTILEDRERIAANLQDKVVQRIFAAGLSLQGAASVTAEPEVQRRITASVGDLDEVLRVLRDTIFGLKRAPRERALRGEILELCAELAPAAELSFRGQLDSALPPDSTARQLEVLRGALSRIGPDAGRLRIAVTADGGSCQTVVEVADGTGTGAQAADHSGLVASAARAGVRIEIAPVPGGTRLVWQVPLTPPVAPPSSSPLSTTPASLSADGGAGRRHGNGRNPVGPGPA
jgi:signal transduction histidine kinase